MMTLRRIGTIALGTIFIGAMVYYSFFQRFVPGAVCDAMPADSRCVYRAASLDELLESPVCSQLDKALGQEYQLKEFAAGSSWFRFSTASEIAIADIPFCGTSTGKSWAAASWVGWRSPWLRWKLENSFDPNLRFLSKYAVWPIWQYDAPDLPEGMTLTLALTDNLILACLSERPADILVLLEAYDRSTPGINP
ncbi:MAG: hypothetical protein JXR25_10480 [Pontiellaceae bacterium]|nr:hypothetical protein [Pontiellaceae bacterium]MBN2785245.1 hypothetical protein [Pontiellaceae bacterium]